MKTLKRVLALSLVVVMVFALVSCGKKLSGTYASKEIIGNSLVYTFKGSSVTLTVDTILGDATFEGEYEIFEDEDGAEKIKLAFGDSDAAKYGGTFSFSKGDDSITIAGVTYNKQ